MAYLSELVGRPVADVNGKLVGRSEDVIATTLGDLPHPIVAALVVKRSSGSLPVSL
jgi:sporulation protein YlmC with PRC-barrel domain